MLRSITIERGSVHSSIVPSDRSDKLRSYFSHIWYDYLLKLPNICEHCVTFVGRNSSILFHVLPSVCRRNMAYFCYLCILSIPNRGCYNYPHLCMEKIAALVIELSENVERAIFISYIK